MTKRGPGSCAPAAAAAALVVGLASLTTASCSQRRVGCAPRADDFAVKITPVAGSKTGTGDCDTRFDDAESVQTMGMQPYFNAPGGSLINRLAIQPFETGNYALNAPNADPPAMDDLPTHHPFAYGNFTTESPDSQDICHVTTLSAAEVEYDKGFTLPPPTTDDGGTDDGGGSDDAGAEAGVEAGAADGGVGDADAGAEAGAIDAGADAGAEAGVAADAGAPMSTDAGGADGGMCPAPEPEPDQLAFPPLHVKYDFGNMRLYVTAALTGSMFAADLTYTSFTGGAACSFKYKLRGVSPSVSCADDCGKPSDDLCHDPENGIPQPDWDKEKDGSVTPYQNKNAIYTVCDPASLTCVLDPKDPHLPQQ